jgi:hypothetical protein
MNEIKGKKILAGRRLGLDTLGHPRQFMSKA